MTLVAQQETSAGEQHGLRSELHALASGCGAFDLDRALVPLAGKDRTRWLNGMVSNNIRDLAAGHGVYAFVLNPQGHIQGDLYTFNRGETLVLEIDRAQAGLLPQLRRYIIMDKVEVQELGDSVSVFGIAGPEADEVLASLGVTFADSAALAFSEFTWNGTPITVVRADNPCVPSYEFWVSKDHAAAFWTSLLQGGAQEVHAAALETFRILCGVPKIGVDIRERTLPQETAQDRALNFTKGCYVGQEIVERIRARGAVHRLLTGFEVSGSAPTAGTPIQVDGKDVGLITSTATVRTRDGEQVIALGLLRKEHLKEHPSEAETFDVAGAKVRPVSLPFSDLLSQLRD
jgi:folate-binding protein YgfZ